MYRKDVEKLPDAAESIPLAVSAASLTTLPEGTPGGNQHYPPSMTFKLIPDYDTVQSNIDDKTHATVFAHVDTPDPADPRQILRKISEMLDLQYGRKHEMAAALQFQFVLRHRDSNRISNDPSQAVEKMVVKSNQFTGLAISNCKISNDGVVTVQLETSHDLLTAVDNFYRVKRTLDSIASRKRMRLSFFYAVEQDPGSAPMAHGIPPDAVCRSRLHFRFRFVQPSAELAYLFAVGLLECYRECSCTSSIYVFARPHWSSYVYNLGHKGHKGHKGRQSRDAFLIWGNRNSKASINFPDGIKGRCSEFSDIDGTANMYLVAAALSVLGRDGLINRAIPPIDFQGVFLIYINATSKP